LPWPAGAAKGPKGLGIIHLLRPHWKALTLALLAVAGETVTDLAEPWPLKIVLDSLLQSKRVPGWMSGIVAWFGPNKLAVLNFAVAAVALIAVVGALSSYLEKNLTTSVGQWVMHDLRRTLYHHIHRLSLAEHDQKRTGDLIGRVTSDIEAIQSFITTALMGILSSVLTLLGIIGVMLYLNWRFTLISLAIAPLLFVAVYLFTRRIKKSSRDVRKKQSELVSLVEEVLSSIRVVKAFAREDYEERRFERESLENVETALIARSIKTKLSPVVEMIVATGTCLMLGYGARLVLAGQLTPGALVVFLLYLGSMYKPMRDLAKMTDTVSGAAVRAHAVPRASKAKSNLTASRLGTPKTSLS
jgi:ATP-binding cassette, subfamily B, bacterial